MNTLRRRKPALLIGEVARRTGVNPSAIRFYEEKALIGSIRRPGNQRCYTRDVIRRVSFIRAAQRVGLTLEEIRRGSGQPTRGPHSDSRGLGRTRDAMATVARRTDRRPGAPAGSTGVVHRLRLPVTRPVCSLQPRRRGRQLRHRSPLPSGRLSSRSATEAVIGRPVEGGTRGRNIDRSVSRLREVSTVAGDRNRAAGRCRRQADLVVRVAETECDVCRLDASGQSPRLADAGSQSIAIRRLPGPIANGFMAPSGWDSTGRFRAAAPPYRCQRGRSSVNRYAPASTNTPLVARLNIRMPVPLVMCAASLLANAASRISTTTSIPTKVPAITRNRGRRP